MEIIYQWRKNWKRELGKEDIRVNGTWKEAWVCHLVVVKRFKSNLCVFLQCVESESGFSV